MAYRIHPLWKVEQFLSPAVISQQIPHTNVTLLSHHIPKTAGSSLRVAFEHALGRRHVYGIYENTGANLMSTGKPVWVPSKAKILHGHFRPCVVHDAMFPHAKKAVWVRDPVERIWSFVGHLLALKERHPHYHLLKASLPGINIESQESIVRALITGDKLKAFTHTYRQFFRTVPIKKFTFVGSKHRYNDSLKRLTALTGIELEPLQINRKSTQMTKLPSSIRKLESHLHSEYEIVGDYL